MVDQTDDGLSFLEGQRRPERGRLAGQFAEWLNKRDAHVSQSDLPHAFASESLGCARKISLRVAGFVVGKDSDPGTLAGGIAKSIGNHLHGVLQDMLAEQYPDFDPEVKWDMGTVTGRADGRYTRDGKLTILEIKTVSEWQFRRSFGDDAPEPAHLMQALMSAKAMGAEQVHLVYIRKTGRANEQQLLEWTYDYAALRPGVEAEFARLSTLVTDATNGRIADTEYLGRNITPDVSKWPCSYCPASRLCRAMGPGQFSRKKAWDIAGSMGPRE